MADNRERYKYRSLAGTLLYLKQRVLPEPGIIASKIQQWMERLTVKNISEENEMVSEIIRMRPCVTFR